MPVLSHRGAVRGRAAARGLQIAACLHVTAETAVLMGALKAGGAEIALAASNPLSTQDDVAQALRDYGITVHARAGVDQATYYRHIHQALDLRPDLVLDDGCDLVNILHTERTDLLEGSPAVVRRPLPGSSGCGRWPPRAR